MMNARFRGKFEKLQREVELISKRVPEGEKDQKQRVIEATRDTFTWVTKYAKTYNEHWIEEGRPDPYEHFPPYPYFQDVFDLIDAERVIWFEKSRDLMLSWACVAYLTRQAMTTPFRGVLLQTQKEDKVVQLIEYAKCLYKTQESWLQAASPLKKPL